MLLGRFSIWLMVIALSEGLPMAHGQSLQRPSAHPAIPAKKTPPVPSKSMPSATRGETGEKARGPSKSRTNESATKDFLGLPDDQSRRIGDKHPQSALRDVTEMSEVRPATYADYAEKKKDGRRSKNGGEIIFIMQSTMSYI
ncbi:MAG TPA: hypothetical protein VG406_20100 [Isosphaeraceae bacterium]|jgi:hypothetical protein|nr:hypothetical protein [Isosphaeraceae bacterium]